MTAPAGGLWPHAASPFHAASLRIQQQLGVAERLDMQGRRGVAAALTEQHQQFFAQLPLLAAASTDGAGQPWATLLFGAPGFIASDNAASLRVRAMPAPDDPLAGSLFAGAAIGLLGIDLATRRRNRVNGQIAAASAAALRWMCARRSAIVRNTFSTAHRSRLGRLCNQPSTSMRSTNPPGA